MATFLYNHAENILSMLKYYPPLNETMECTMLRLQAILIDAEEKQEQEQNHDLRDWLKELQNLFYQIEDSIDEYKREFFEQEGTGKKVHAPFLCSDRTSAHKSKLTRKMKKLCDHLDAIAVRMYEFHLTEKLPDCIGRMKKAHSFLRTTELSIRHLKSNWQFHYSLTDAPSNYEHDPYAAHLEYFKHNRGIFHIVGEAGMGKSTLAKFFYHDEDIANKYNLRFWVCVKEGFDTQRLMKEVYSLVAGKEICNNLTEQQLDIKVQQFLKGRPFLFVFQDLSITNLDDSYALEKLLDMGNQESKILVTTQSEEIADAMTSFDKVYMPGKQPDQNSWRPTQMIFKVEKLLDKNPSTLFKKYAFIDRHEVNNPELTKIEDKILEKCKGVPLAIKCMASLLSSKTRIAEWKKVEEKLSAQEEEDDSILPVLRLCYDQMPTHLKPCFLHCSQLPDRILSSNDVIQLWMAHGLLHSPEEINVSMENIGEKYFMELWSRCFVQEIEEHGLGYWFKLHPLIQKLAQVLVQEQSEGSVGKPVAEIKSITFQVRDMVLTNASLTGNCISKFKCLRLLHLGNANLQKIPNAIGTLKSLRYLDLHGNQKIKRLPNSICNLQSLQTLILESCSELKELPNDIRNLISLKYLWVTSDELHLHKNGVGTMTSLKFLAIGGCNNLQVLFERPVCLAGLETLMIYDCKTLKSLPDEMRSLRSLQNLIIWNCKQLELTLGEVEFRLQRFTIRELTKVEELPRWLEQSADTLRILQIITCPIVLDPDTFEVFKGIQMAKILGSVRIKGAPPGLQFQFENRLIRNPAESTFNKKCYY